MTTLTHDSGFAGWKQFLAEKRRMLDAHDRAQTHQHGKPVKMGQEPVAEHEFRGWLRRFLPRRYAVTSGFVIPQRDGEFSLRHFDVIVYDALNSPILWVEDSPDKAQAVPVEYVLAVFEVKSRLALSSARKAMSKLCELNPLLEHADSPDARYKKYLPPTFVCALVFFELVKENEKEPDVLRVICDTVPVRGFYGGIVLRSDRRRDEESGHIRFMFSENEELREINKGSLSDICILRSLGSEKRLGTVIIWWMHTFQEFAFTIVEYLNGRRDKLYPSFYALPFPAGTIELGSSGDQRQDGG